MEHKKVQQDGRHRRTANKNAAPGTPGQSHSVDEAEDDTATASGDDKDKIHDAAAAGATGADRKQDSEGKTDTDSGNEENEGNKNEEAVQNAHSLQASANDQSSVQDNLDNLNSIAMSSYGNVSVDQSMFNILKTGHVPASTPDDNDSSSSESIGPAQDESTSTGNDGKGRGPVADVYVPVQSMVQDMSTGHQPQSGEEEDCQNYVWFEKTIGIFIKDKNTNKIERLPEEIKSGPKLCIDGNMLQDDEGTVFEIKTDSSGKFVYEQIGTGHVKKLTVESQDLKPDYCETSSQGSKHGPKIDLGVRPKQKSGNNSDFNPSVGTMKKMVDASETKESPEPKSNKMIQTNTKNAAEGDVDLEQLCDFLKDITISDTAGVPYNNISKQKAASDSGDSCSDGFVMVQSHECAENIHTKGMQAQEKPNDESHKTDPLTQPDAEGSLRNSVPKMLKSQEHQYQPTGPTARATLGQSDLDSDCMAGNTSEKTVTGAAQSSTSRKSGAAERDLHLTMPIRCLYTDKTNKEKESIQLVEADLDEYMKMSFILNNDKLFGEKSKEIQRTLDVQACCDKGKLVIKEVSCDRDIDFIINRIVKIILEHSDDLVVNEVPVRGLDGAAIAKEILKSSVHQKQGVYTHYMAQREMLCCVYSSKHEQDIVAVITNAVKVVCGSSKKTSTEQINLDTVFKEVFVAEKVEEKLQEKFPDVSLSLETFDTEDLVVVKVSGIQKQVEEVERWLRTNFVEKYCVNVLGLGKIKNREKVGDKLSDILERKIELLKEDMPELHLYLNENTARISICTTKQPLCDSTGEKLRKCIQQQEFNCDEIDTPDERKKFEIFIRKREQSHNLVVDEQGHKFNIIGLKEDIRYIQSYMDGILKEIRDKKNARKQREGNTDGGNSQKEPEHRVWSHTDGHMIKVCKGDVQAMQDANVTVEFMTEDVGKPTAFKRCSDGRYRMDLAIPSYNGGQSKEKHLVRTAFNVLCNELEKTNSSKVAVQMEAIGGWQTHKLLKQFLSPMNDKDKKITPLCVSICCQNDEDYSSCCTACDEAFNTMETQAQGQRKTCCLTVKIIKGKLDECKADVIVNSTNDRLEFSMGTVSNALLEKAGNKLQTTAKSIHPGLMDFWEILETGGYGLECQFVFHGVLENGAKRSKENLKKLKDFTFACLKKAEAKQCTSIAFPALGTGKLDYQPSDVAHVMFEAVEDFRIKYRDAACYLENVDIVIHHGDREVLKAFQLEEKCRGPECVSQEIILGHILLKGCLMDLNRIRTDSVVYLWESSHMHTTSPKKHVLLKAAGSSVIMDWTKKRDNGKTVFNTMSGNLDVHSLIHMKCPDSINEDDIQNSLTRGLILAQENQSEQVVIYFNSGHPMLMRHRIEKLADVCLVAVTKIAPDNGSIRKIMLAVDDSHFAQLKQYFALQRQPSVGMDGKCVNQVEPSPQEICVEERNPIDTEPETKEANQMEKIKWKHSRLEETDSKLRRYVLVYNIPERYQSTKDLIRELYKPPFPVKPPRLVYSKGLRQAVLICNTDDDAAELSEYKEHTDFRFVRVTKQSLSCYKASCCGKEIVKKMTSVKDKFMKKLDGTEVTVSYSQKGGDEIIVEAPTLCQVRFALEKMYKLVGLDLPSRKMQNMNNQFGFTEIDSFDISECHWDILRSVEKELLVELEKECTVSFKSGRVMCLSDKHVQRWEKFKQAGLNMNNKQVEEFPMGDTNEETAVTYCNEICENLQLICCVYVARKKSIYAFSERYPDIQKVSHQLMVKQKKIAVTGRRGRHFANQIDLPKADEEPQQTFKAPFVRSVQAPSLLETFTTAEGITVKVYKSNLLSADVDCIVNAANEHLNHGGGVARIIADAAGRELIREGDNIVRELGSVQVGTAVCTTAGELPYKCVIHAVGPCWYDYRPYSLKDVERCEKDLHTALMDSFFQAERKGLKRIALPAISSAIFAVPEEICTYQYALATVKYSRKSASSSTGLREIHFVDIKDGIIKRTQDSFKQIQHNESRPYNIEKFVYAKTAIDRKGDGAISNPSTRSDFNAQKSTRRQRSESATDNASDYVGTDVFEPVYFEDNGYFNFHFGVQQHLVLCKGDLFTVKSDALVTIEDQTGSGTGVVSKCMFHKMTNAYYTTDKRKQFANSKRTGEVVVTCGFNNDYRKVFHAVFPYEMIQERRDKRKSLLLKTYYNIFDTATHDPHVASITMTLFGTGSDKPDDVNLSGNAFLDSYLMHCTQNASSEHPTPLKLNVVCRDDKKFFPLKKILLQAIDAMSKQKPSPSALHRQISDEIQRPQSEKPTDGKNSTAASDTSDELCVICMEKIKVPRTLDCGHSYCTDCIELSLSYKNTCPTCGAVCGVVTGDQPQGKMHIYTDRNSYCSGHEHYGQIKITYNFPSGIQEKCHPNPGNHYQGITRSAFLPDNRQGNIILQMLRVAFSRKLVFTIGSSRTTGEEGVITWNDIHHKTNPNPHGKFGYPDTTYLQRVTEELQAKGVTEKDIPAKEMDSINRVFKESGEWRKTSQRKHYRY